MKKEEFTKGDVVFYKNYGKKIDDADIDAIVNGKATVSYDFKVKGKWVRYTDKEVPFSMLEHQKTFGIGDKVLVKVEGAWREGVVDAFSKKTSPFTYVVYFTQDGKRWSLEFRRDLVRSREDARQAGD